MAYEPTNWKSGDVVTSAKLNKLENGVAGAGGALVVHDVNEVLDKTYAEIAAAAETSVVMLAIADGEGAEIKYLSGYGTVEGMYGVAFDSKFYTTDSPDGYPESHK